MDRTSIKCHPVILSLLGPQFSPPVYGNQVQKVKNGQYDIFANKTKKFQSRLQTNGEMYRPSWGKYIYMYIIFVFGIFLYIFIASLYRLYLFKMSYIQ